MLVRKITTGWVTQVYDTVKKQWVSQDFHAGDQVEYETTEGETLDIRSTARRAVSRAYMQFNMVQPSQAFPNAEVE